MGKLLEPSQNIERSIMKKYRKELWNPFIKAVKNYELVQEVQERKELEIELREARDKAEAANIRKAGTK